MMGFRTGWSGPTDPRFPDTSAKRHVMTARLGFSTGNGERGVVKKKKTAVESSGTGEGGDQFSRVLPQDCQAPSEEKNLPGCVLETGWSSSSYCCTGRNCNGCSSVKIRTGGIIRSIMNESCHRRCFAWLASSARLSRGCPVFPALSLLAC